MATKKKRPGYALGSQRVTVVTGTVGFEVEQPEWAGDTPVRLVDAPHQVILNRHLLGWTLNLGNTPVISMNDGDLVALGVALIQAGSR